MTKDNRLREAAQALPAIGTRHSVIDDAHALLIGVTLAAFGLVVLKSAGLVTSGVAGLALIASLRTGYAVGPLFFAFNIPFIAIAVRYLGWQFALKSCLTVGAFAMLAAAIPHWMSLTSHNLMFAAVLGGMLLGMGVLSLARHQASFGGFGVVALIVQEKGKMRAGVFLMYVDLFTILIALLSLDMRKAAFSAISVAAMDGILALNHRPGRYSGSSAGSRMQ